MMTTTAIRITILHCDQEKQCFLPKPVGYMSEQQRQMMEIQNIPGLPMPSLSWIQDYEIWRSWKSRNKSDYGKGEEDDEEPFLIEDDTNNDALGQLPPIFDTVRDLHTFNHVGRSLVERLRDEYNSIAMVTVMDYVDLYCNLHIDGGVGLWHIRDVAYGCIVPIHHLPVSDSLKTKLLRAWTQAKNKVTTCTMDQSEMINNEDECHDLEEHILWELNVHAIPSLDDVLDESGRSENSRISWTMCWKQPPTPKHANHQQQEQVFAFDSPLIEKARVIKRQVI
jgi:hypothetical protein